MLKIIAARMVRASGTKRPINNSNPLEHLQGADDVHVTTGNENLANNPQPDLAAAAAWEGNSKRSWSRRRRTSIQEECGMMVVAIFIRRQWLVRQEIPISKFLVERNYRDRIAPMCATDDACLIPKEIISTRDRFGTCSVRRTFTRFARAVTSAALI